MAGVQFVFLGVLCLLASAEGAYPNTNMLDANYKLSWSVNTTHIEFQTEVQTAGWFGFGISVGGSMYPADVVIGYYDHNKAMFNDYHTTAYTRPTMDSSQDWSLQSGSSINNRLIFTFSRAMNTGDGDDEAILGDMWALGKTDTLQVLPQTLWAKEISYITDPRPQYGDQIGSFIWMPLFKDSTWRFNPGMRHPFEENLSFKGL